MKVPSKRGGKCPCGAVVRFDVVMRRIEHFMECPVVDRKIAKGVAPVEIDEAAVQLGRELLEARA